MTNNLQKHLLTEIDGPTALLEENFLKPNISHLIKLRVKTTSVVPFGVDYFHYYFFTNAAPVHGTCYPQTEEGQAMVDDFIFVCEGTFATSLE